MAEINPETLESLAAKLDGLDLTDAERAVLDRVLDRAASYEPEVEGFGMDMGFGEFKLASGADLSRTAFRLGSGSGILKPTPRRMEM